MQLKTLESVLQYLIRGLYHQRFSLTRRLCVSFPLWSVITYKNKPIWKLAKWGRHLIRSRKYALISEFRLRIWISKTHFICDNKFPDKTDFISGRTTLETRLRKQSEDAEKGPEHRLLEAETRIWRRSQNSSKLSGWKI